MVKISGKNRERLIVLNVPHLREKINKTCANRPFWCVNRSSSHPGKVKAGRIFLPGAALLLHIAGGQPQIHGIIDHPAVLVGGDAPPDAVLCGLVKGGVLAHDTGDEAAGVGLVPCGHLVEDGKTVVDVAGQGQMPQDDALL